MKSFARLCLSSGLLLAAAPSYAETRQFQLSTLFPSGSVGSVSMQGTFSGELVDGRITGVTAAELFIGGNAFKGNGSLFVLQYEFGQRKWVEGGYLSLDGKDNNILFIDTNYAQGNASFYNYFYSVTGLGNSAFAPSFYRYQVPQTTGLKVAAVTAPALPEPASWAMLIAGFATVGAGLRRRPARVRLHAA